ncbi:MAG: sigma-70 family RNA polymerase sigma factor [Ruminococcus sp.]|nr:sigma-70 family RNA polymerase sigma factor [Ruminococcus sp.]
MDEPKLIFEQIYQRTKTAALRYITSKCLAIADIDDIFQDTFLSVYRSVCNMTEPIENEEAFVINAAKKSLSRYYGVLTKLRSQISSGLMRMSDRKSHFSADEVVDVETLIADRALCDEIFEAISSMPADVQRIVYMYYVLDMPLSMAARELGMTESAAKGRLYRALERIRRSYKRREML